MSCSRPLVTLRTALSGVDSVTLTPLERRILILRGHGRRDKDIAAELGYCRSHITNTLVTACKKLSLRFGVDVRTATQAIYLIGDELRKEDEEAA